MRTNICGAHQSANLSGVAFDHRRLPSVKQLFPRIIVNRNFHNPLGRPFLTVGRSTPKCCSSYTYRVKDDRLLVYVCPKACAGIGITDWKARPD
jgi:hypothetical protein